jgi:hypothetical protein
MEKQLSTMSESDEDDMTGEDARRGGVRKVKR